MVDRRQEQSRLTAERIGADGRAGRDLGWIVAVVVTSAGFAWATRGLEGLSEWASDLDGRAASLLSALVLLVPLGAATYAVRRYQDAMAASRFLARLGGHDALTGLPNRQFLGEAFDQMLARARRDNGVVAVCFVGLEGFKPVNDTHGHEIGDQVMIGVAERLTASVGDATVVLRYGGTEFVVVSPEVTDAQGAERLAKRLLKAVEAPFTVGTDVVQISASIGVAVTEPQPTRADEVLADADAALYQAKAVGPGRFALFDRAMREQLTPSTAERRLREALERGEFRLYYQPIVSLWTRRLVGAEALLRWNDPTRGLVPPGEFLPALEETGLIVPVGDWIIEEVCRQSRRWQDSHPDRPALNIKINVSARELSQATFVPHLGQVLTDTGADPDRICLEISEGALAYDLAMARSTLREAKTLGVSLAIDDFGTGYAALSYLRQFNLDLLTIDRTFVAALGHSKEDTTIVEHVIALAKALGIVTVAEGVETEEQVEALRKMGCDLAQGHWFSHPQPPDVITHLMDSGANRQEWRPPAPPADDHQAPVVSPARFNPPPAASPPSPR